MAKKAYRARNWNHYNKSLVNRGSLTLWLSEELVNEWKAEKKCKGKRGRPEVYPDSLVLTALTLRQLYNLPLRSTQGLMRSISELMGLGFQVPDYSLLSKRAQRLKVDLKVKQKKAARHVLVDSTGIQVIGEGEWKIKLHGKTKSKYGANFI